MCGPLVTTVDIPPQEYRSLLTGKTFSARINGAQTGVGHPATGRNPLVSTTTDRNPLVRPTGYMKRLTTDIPSRPRWKTGCRRCHSLAVCLSVCLSVCVSDCLSVCLSVQPVWLRSTCPAAVYLMTDDYTQPGRPVACRTRATAATMAHCARCAI